MGMFFKVYVYIYVYTYCHAPFVPLVESLRCLVTFFKENIEGYCKQNCEEWFRRVNCHFPITVTLTYIFFETNILFVEIRMNTLQKIII